jgi:hypothetical protein
MRRPRRRLKNVAHNPAPCRTSNGHSQKNFKCIASRDSGPAVRGRP